MHPTRTLVSDGVAEPPEHLVLQLDAPSVGMLGTTTTFILTITDVLPGQVLSFGASAATRPGPSVALDGDTLAVGAPDATTVNGATGEVLIYTHSGLAWTGPTSIPGVTAGEAFGASVALSGNVRRCTPAAFKRARRTCLNTTEPPGNSTRCFCRQHRWPVTGLAPQ